MRLLLSISLLVSAARADTFNGALLKSALIGDSTYVNYGTAGALTTVTTDASTTPTTTAVTLSGAQNAVRVWTGEQAVAEPFFYLYASISGGTASKIQLFRWSSRIIAAAPGSTIALGTTDGRSLKISAMTFPAAIETPAGVSGTANCDKAGPPLWTPTAAHITLPTANRSFAISSVSTQLNLFISEYDGTAWSPVRWLRVETNRTATVRATYTQVSLANYAGTPVTITAPTGSTVGGSMATMSLPITAVTGTTRSVSDVAGFKTAIAAAVAGDEIVLADGTYALDLTSVVATNFAANVSAGNKGMEGILLRSQSGNRDNCVITCSATNTGTWIVSNANATRYASIKDLTFAFTNGPAVLDIQNGKWLLQNVHVYGVNTNATDLLDFVTTTTNSIIADFLFCSVDHSAGDCFNGSGNAAGSTVRLVACDASVAGPGAADQCLTTHSGLPLYAYGCSFTDANLNVVANDADTSPTYLFFCNTGAGARTAGVFNFSSFGSNFDVSSSAQVAIAPFTNGYMICTFSRQLLRIAAAKTWVVDHNLLYGFAGLGRSIFPSVGGNSFNFNILDTFSEGIRIDNSAAGGTVNVLGNTVVNCTTALNWNDANLTITSTNNACKGNTTSISCSATSNGHMTKGYNVLDPAVSGNYTAGTSDTTGSDAGLSSALIPTASGNCDGNGDTSAVDYVGSSDPFGLVLIYKPSRVSRGAREIPAVYSGAVLYPDLW